MSRVRRSWMKADDRLLFPQYTLSGHLPLSCVAAMLLSSFSCGTFYNTLRHTAVTAICLPFECEVWKTTRVATSRSIEGAGNANQNVELKKCWSLRDVSSLWSTLRHKTLHETVLLVNDKIAAKRHENSFQPTVQLLALSLLAGIAHDHIVKGLAADAMLLIDGLTLRENPSKDRRNKVLTLKRVVAVAIRGAAHPLREVPLAIAIVRNAIASPGKELQTAVLSWLFVAVVYSLEESVRNKFFQLLSKNLNAARAKCGCSKAQWAKMLCVWATQLTSALVLYPFERVIHVAVEFDLKPSFVLPPKEAAIQKLKLVWMNLREMKLSRHGIQDVFSSILHPNRLVTRARNTQIMLTAGFQRYAAWIIARTVLTIWLDIL